MIFTTICKFQFNMYIHFAHFWSTSSNSTFVVFNLIYTRAKNALHSSFSAIFQTIMAYHYENYTYWTRSCFQYLFTTLSTFLNHNLFEHNSEAFALYPTVMTIADVFLFLNSRRSFSLILLIHQPGFVFQGILIDDSISWQSISIFSLTRYCTIDILFIFNLCQCSTASTLITTLSTDLAALIHQFKWILISFSAWNFFVSNVEMTPDIEYTTIQNRIKADIPAFCTDFIKASIKSSCDFRDKNSSWPNIILLFPSSIFGRLSTVVSCLRLLQVTSF